MEVHFRTSLAGEATFEFGHESRSDPPVASTRVDRKVMDPPTSAIVPPEDHPNDLATILPDKEEIGVPTSRPLEFPSGIGRADVDPGRLPEFYDRGVVRGEISPDTQGEGPLHRL